MNPTIERAPYEIAADEVRKIIKRKEFRSLNLVEGDTKTGITFFRGKDRLCKILKTKSHLRIEINVELPEEISSISGMEYISPERAYEKHLGTMRHIYRGNDIKEIKKIMLAAVNVFKETKK